MRSVFLHIWANAICLNLIKKAALAAFLINYLFIVLTSSGIISLKLKFRPILYIPVLPV